MADGSKKKRVGGVKPSRKLGQPKRAVPARPVASKKRKQVGGVVASTVPESPIVQSCPENCAGEWMHGTWIHTRGCKYTPALWKSHDRRAEDWNCAWNCDPTELPNAFTHSYDCAFWDHYPTLTPF